jgi:hypothetical protein
MDTTISGTEKVDATGAFSFKELIKSRLTLVPTLSYVYSIIYFPLVWLGLNMLAGKSLEAALYCSMLSVLIGGALVVYKWKIAQRLLKLRLPLQSIGKYVVASAVMAVVILIFPQPAKITATLGLVVVGSVTYIGTLALIEKNFRIIIRATIEEVQNRLGYHRRRVVSEE